MPPIYGFTLLRNGLKYDYSFLESLKSLAPLCRHVVLALGEGEDDTEAALSGLDFLQIAPTVWDEKLRRGGLILSQQTNVALEHLRSSVDAENAWGIYLQADEVLHEQDVERIRSDIAAAEEQGCDVVRFRYFHFWQSHHKVAINKKWYPQEIRAVRLRSAVESWGDAQSFRGFNKVYESDAFVYHYGHVREEEKYEAKKAGFFRMYAGDEGLKKYVAKMEKKDARTETLDFWGPHPAVMKERIERMGERFTVSRVESVSILSAPKLEHLKIRAKEVLWNRPGGEVTVSWRGHWTRRLLRREFPFAMRSKLARPWSEETRLMLLLARAGVGVDSLV